MFNYNCHTLPINSPSRNTKALNTEITSTPQGLTGRQISARSQPHRNATVRSHFIYISYFQIPTFPLYVLGHLWAFNSSLPSFVCIKKKKNVHFSIKSPSSSFRPQGEQSSQCEELQHSSTLQIKWLSARDTIIKWTSPHINLKVNYNIKECKYLLQMVSEFILHMGALQLSFI